MVSGLRLVVGVASAMSDECNLLSIQGAGFLQLVEDQASVQTLLEMLAMGGGPRKAVHMLQDLAGQSVLANVVIDDVTKMALESMNKTLVDVSQRIIINNHESDQRFLDEHAAMVGKCAGTFDEDKRQDSQLGGQVLQREDGHRHCRMDLLDLIDVSYTEDKCQELDTFMETLSDISCVVPRSTKIIGDWFMGLDRWVSGHWPKFQDLSRGCLDHENERANQGLLCNEKQHAFEQGFCTWRAAVFATCSDYVSCYDRAVDMFESSKGNVLENEASRKIDWGSIKKIKCYIGVMLSDKTNVERLQEYNQCNTLRVSTNHLNIDVPGYARRRSCDLSQVADHPCTSDFSERYRELPDTIQCLPCAPLPEHLRFDSMCVENLRLDDDNEGWSVEAQKPFMGSAFHGPFGASDLLATRSYKLTPKARFDIGLHLDTYSVFGNEQCTLKVGDQTQNIQTPQGECAGGWEAVETDGNGASAFGLANETNCMRRVKFADRVVPDDGILTVELQCPLERGAWGFHNFFFQASACPDYDTGIVY